MITNITIEPAEVHRTLGKYMNAEGMPIVVDLKRSKGAEIIDSKSGKRYLDLFSFYASQPVGLNHPKLNDPDFEEKLLRVGKVKPSNPDVYTVEYAEFVDTFARIVKPENFKYLFFIEGGALGVENALKAAIDWKVRKNLSGGGKEEIGNKIIHFENSFHGRTGYTMSLTNTIPEKVKYFPKFKWPRVVAPAMRFPLTEVSVREVEKAERIAVEQIKEAFRSNKDDIAAIITEPIQAEGGDYHFRREFLVQLRELADENDAMLIFDEIQTGLGITGKMWAYEWFVEPDLVVFGKKTQVCGFMSSTRIDEVDDNVFKSAMRINSTWGGNLTDMIRAAKYFEIIEEENLIENALQVGDKILERLEELQDNYPYILSNARGRGLMCAVDFPTSAERDMFRKKLFEQGVIILGCGKRTIRFRPHLDISWDIIEEAFDKIEETLDGWISKQ